MTETIQAKAEAPCEGAEVVAACALASVPGMGGAALATVVSTHSSDP